MRTCITFFICVFFANTLSAQYDNNLNLVTFRPFFLAGPNADSVIRKNHINRELIYTYQVIHGKPLDSLLSAVIFYNELGKPVEKWVFSDAEKSVEKCSYEYDSVNHSMKLIFTPDPGNPDADLFQIEYDSLGRELNLYVFNHDTTELIIRHKKYDTAGRIKAVYTSVNDSSFYLSNTYTYGTNGRLEQFNQYDEAGGFQFRFTYKYNAQKREEKIYKKTDVANKIISTNNFDQQGHTVHILPNIWQFMYGGSVVSTLSVDPYKGQYDNNNSVTTVTAWWPHRYMKYNDDQTFFEYSVRSGNATSRPIEVIRHYYLHD